MIKNKRARAELSQAQPKHGLKTKLVKRKTEFQLIGVMFIRQMIIDVTHIKKCTYPQQVKVLLGPKK